MVTEFFKDFKSKIDFQALEQGIASEKKLFCVVLSTLYASII